MGDKSTIDWCDATWSPVTGCTKVSPGCGMPRPGSDDEVTGLTGECYALAMARRLKLMGSAKYQTDGEAPLSGPGFGFAIHPETLNIPLKWTKPRRIFTNSMSDLFHPDILKEYVTDRFGHSYPFLAEILAVMARTPRHTYQTLTKRPKIMAAVLNEPRFRLDVNSILMRDGHPVMAGGFDSAWPEWMWWGASIELDRYAFRSDHVRAAKAAVRFLSLEPLLGPLPSLNLKGIDFVIVGGESGPKARPMHPDWARDIRDRCADAGVGYFFKQWGEFAPLADHPDAGDIRSGYVGYNGQWSSPTAKIWGTNHPPEIMVRVGKKNAGRLLDGREWNEMPERSHV